MQDLPWAALLSHCRTASTLSFVCDCRPDALRIRVAITLLDRNKMHVIRSTPVVVVLAALLLAGNASAAPKHQADAAAKLAAAAS
ncbi:MAG: hypothetical protein WBA88_06460, partial [Pseudaminobacter sp.]